VENGVDGVLGNTNNIAPPNTLSVRDNAGTLTLALRGTETLFGYGYAILTSHLWKLFSTLAFKSPRFPGGFPGIESTIPFDRVALLFESTQAVAFAMDNITFALRQCDSPDDELLPPERNGLPHIAAVSGKCKRKLAGYNPRAFYSYSRAVQT